MNELQRQYIQKLLRLVESQRYQTFPEPCDGQLYRLFVMSHSFMFKYMEFTLGIRQNKFAELDHLDRYALYILCLKLCLRGESGRLPIRDIFKKFNYNPKARNLGSVLRFTRTPEECVEWKHRQQIQEVTIEQWIHVLMNIDFEPQRLAIPRTARFDKFMRRQQEIEVIRKITSSTSKVCEEEERVVTHNTLKGLVVSMLRDTIMVEDLANSVAFVPYDVAVYKQLRSLLKSHVRFKICTRDEWYRRRNDFIPPIFGWRRRRLKYVSHCGKVVYLLALELDKFVRATSSISSASTAKNIHLLEPRLLLPGISTVEHLVYLGMARDILLDVEKHSWMQLCRGLIQ